ncbi:MAG: thioredoxin domain-containing protein [Deltaproteobacteria bacterium]|nr:thioredoxin domain-containing protein [Deltaproteobacteria bacterium]
MLTQSPGTGWRKTIVFLLILSLLLPGTSVFGKQPSVTPEFTNRLIDEKSPYLLQHAHNPVDWYPWGEEAFSRARKEGKLIFLSIGYSTCHWCHVMAHESFEDVEVAALLNRDFISIKVDREERPDIDQVYMQVCQRLTGSGGWPLTIIMTPDGIPVFAGTFLPKHDRYARMGMMNLLPTLMDRWKSDPETLLASGEKVLESLRPKEQVVSSNKLDQQVFSVAENLFKKSFDKKYGGFGNAPKFPRPHSLVFLLRRYRQTGDARLLEMAEVTLQAMRRGGIYDQVGFGFHRYSTDKEWLVPHFEKMLYDQAGLALAYIEAYQVTGRDEYARTVGEIFTYMLRDMSAPEGGFYSAEDADSEGEEGKFYLWSEEEITHILGKQDADLFKQVYATEKDGNFDDEITGEDTGTNILHLAQPLVDQSKKVGITRNRLREKMDQDLHKLFIERETRVRPHRDDKIITAWNGLMISALARGGQALGEAQYVATAELTADFILTKLRNKDGRLLRRYRDGEAAIPAFADDYAFLARGLLDLYAATLEPQRLGQAVELADDLVKLFHDEENGGLYESASDAEQLVLRPKNAFDGALPAASSVALEVYSRLFLLTADVRWQTLADRLLLALSSEVLRYPAGYAQLLQGAAWLLDPSREVVISGTPGTETFNAMHAVIKDSYAPESVFILRPTNGSAEIIKLAPYVEWMLPVGDKAAAYVCQDFTCQKPLTDPQALKRQLAVPPKMR